MLSTRGNWSVSALVPVPPTVSSLVYRSSNLVMPEPFMATQTLTSLLALPSQVNFVASNCVALADQQRVDAMPRPMVPIAVPSFGATR